VILMSLNRTRLLPKYALEALLAPTVSLPKILAIVALERADMPVPFYWRPSTYA